MKITLAVVLCQLAATPADKPACREEIVPLADSSVMACALSQAAIARWKAATIYHGDQWTVARIKCVPGEYVPKEAT